MNIRNGALLKTAIQGLLPGQKLEIHAGTYSVDSWFTIDLEGSAENPIWICAAPGETPVITRPNANQNVINVGVNNPSQYLVFSNLEITGGDTLIKLYDCANVWIHQCHIHDGGGVGIAANSRDTDRLYLTENEIHATGGSAEGMYLGANYSASRMTHSIVAGNHIYDCYGSQGDGIEVKQGSYDNWIVANHVHDTNYPGITAYGTDGLGINIIERNIVYRSGDNAVQVQGEAIVRNNLIMAGAYTAFTSKDHQGETRDLEVVHNTIVNTGRAVNLSSWNDRPGMVLANNAIYSRDGEAVRFPYGANGVTITGNVVYGTLSGVSSGFITGLGLDDFVSLSWDAQDRDAALAAGSVLIGAGDALFTVDEDITGALRGTEVDSGAWDY